MIIVAGLLRLLPNGLGGCLDGWVSAPLCSLVFAGEPGQTCSCGHRIRRIECDISLPNGNGGLGRRFATDRVTSFIYRFYFLKPYALRPTEFQL